VIKFLHFYLAKRKMISNFGVTKITSDEKIDNKNDSHGILN